MGSWPFDEYCMRLCVQSAHIPNKHTIRRTLVLVFVYVMLLRVNANTTRRHNMIKKWKWVLVALLVMVLGISNSVLPPAEVVSPEGPSRLVKVVVGATLLGGVAMFAFPVQVCAATGVCLVEGGMVGNAVAGAVAWTLVETAGSVRSNPLTPCTIPIVWGGGLPMAVCHDRDRGWVLLLPRLRIAEAVCPKVNGSLFRIVDLLLLRSDLGFGCFAVENGTVLKIGYLFIAMMMGLITFLRQT